MARHRKPPAVKKPKQRKPQRPHRITGLATAATPLAVLLAMVASDTTSQQSPQDAAKSGEIAPVTPVGPFPADEEFAVNGELPAPGVAAPTAPVIPLDVLAALPAGGAAVPELVLRAYLRAESLLSTTQPGCHLTWSLLASIGRIESGHARGGQVDTDGKTVSPILGPALNGKGFAAIRDTDNGAFDGDPTWDRAVGPMQFIPATWARYGADATGDGVADPHNVYDAAVSAGRYLCSGGQDLSDPAQAAKAVFRYNHSQEYVNTVLTWAANYANGVTAIPQNPVAPSPDSRRDDPGVLALPAPSPVAAIQNPGSPQLPITMPGPGEAPVQQPAPLPGQPAPAPAPAPVPGQPAPAPAPAPAPGQPAPTPAPAPAPTPAPAPAPAPAPTPAPAPAPAPAPSPAPAPAPAPAPGTDWYDWTVWVPRNP